MANEMTVVEIDPTKKYLLALEGKLSYEEFVQLRDGLDQFVSDLDKTFMVLYGVKLVKVDVRVATDGENTEAVSIAEGGDAAAKEDE